MSDEKDGRKELSDDFRDRVLEVLRRLRDEDPPTAETIQFARDVAAAAEGRETPYWVIALKYFYLSALQGAGHIDEAMVVFLHFRLYCDRHPGEDTGNYLLIVYKWMVYNARLFPKVSKSELESLMQDFEARLRREGLSLRPLHQARMDWAVVRGRAEEAARHFREWQAAPRGAVSDCPACELNDRVEYLISLRRDEEAVSAAAPLLAGELKCSSVPERTYGALLAPLLRLGRLDESLALQHKGFGRIAGKMRYVDTAAEHITYLTKKGELDEATRVFESFLPLALETTTPLKKLDFLLSAWLLLDRLRAAGADTAGLNLPAFFHVHRRQNGYDLESLMGWFREETLGLAGSFDARDETDAYSQRIAAAFDTTSWRT